MNKLLFHEGGQPLHLDDLSFMQANISGLVNTIHASAGNCILWGVYISTLGWVSCSRGAILYDGIIYEVSPAKIDHEGGRLFTLENLYWELSALQEGEKIFEDGQEKATRIRYQAKLIASFDKPSGKIAVSETPSLAERAFFSKPLVDISITSQYLSLCDYTVMSKYSAILTLRVDRHAKFDEIIGNIEVTPRWRDHIFDTKNPKEIAGEVQLPRRATKEPGAVILELDNGKFYYRRGVDTSTSQGTVSFVDGRVVTMHISWGYSDLTDYELLDVL